MSEETFPSTRTNVLVGPMRTAEPMAKIYEPVDCDFTDDLEYASVRQIPVEISHWSPALILVKSVGIIDDIVTENKEEFLIISNGDRIRLDRLYSLKICTATTAS